ncbi:HPr kinase/phosphorylase [Sphingomonas sp. SUN039]|uniref:HPr kinase/phosphorylase n=1 Tax=Sphingomonas sp. SUN039 TaxID=2937787 RepID=UPI0021645BA6|nr:HPr kinase/phosphatase C-terminal domain-containing protein [Sphingomonas sp. SUN039]UVO55825.1 HPr kinase/phosphatase C-terminal domain-containing protein [Sphingomonas sp. SUN039]
MVAMLSSDTLHATTVSVGGRAIMIEGVSGAGKSDLALRLIDRGALLVSDDYTFVQRRAGRIVASAPATIAGKIEVRGLGILDMPNVAEAPVALVVTLGEPAARLPEPGQARSLLGVDIPLLSLDGREASAPFKAELALQRLGTPA